MDNARKSVDHNSTGAASVNLIHFYSSKVASNATCTLSFCVSVAATPGEAVGNGSHLCGATSAAAPVASMSNVGFGGGLIQVAVGFAGGFGAPLTKRSGFALYACARTSWRAAWTTLAWP